MKEFNYNKQIIKEWDTAIFHDADRIILSEIGNALRNIINRNNQKEDDESNIDSDLVESLDWAIKELNGQNRYDEDVMGDQEQKCYDRARAILTKAKNKLDNLDNQF